MKTSKYAPRTPQESRALSQAEKIKQEKDKAARLLGRLRWKAELLMVSYSRAVEILHYEFNQQGHNLDGHAFVRGATSKHAETMFKVDFFEFYTLMERYITVCLGILGVKISGDAPRTNFNALKFITNPDLRRIRPEASHAFHANLLEALDQDDCPLHASLGIQDVRIQLGLAKDYRNAWKDADEKLTAPNRENEYTESRKNVRLEDLNLSRMLTALIEGCDNAYAVVQSHNSTKVNENEFTSKDFEPHIYQYDSMEMDDIPLEYMDDAMELD